MLQISVFFKMFSVVTEHDTAYSWKPSFLLFSVEESLY